MRGAREGFFGGTLSRERLGLVALLALWGSIGYAAEGDPQILGVRVGIADQYKVGYWAPVEVQVLGGAESFEGLVTITVPDGDDVPTTLIRPQPLVVSPGATTTVRLFAKIGQMHPEVSVKLISKNDTFSRTLSPGDGPFAGTLEFNQPLIVSVGQPLGVATSTAEADGGGTVVYARLRSAGDFPTRWYGYDAVNAVLLCTSDVEFYRQLPRTSAQMVALDTWVRLGGRLVLSVGANAEEILAAEGPLAAFAPGTFAGQVALRQTSAWETYAETSERLDTEALVDAAGDIQFNVPRLENVRGRIEAFEGSKPTDLPLVIRAPHGLGEVVFVAADLDKPPFLAWKAREAMLDKLLARPRSAARQVESEAPGPTSFGYTDISGQLRSALEQFTGVKLVPFSLVAMLIVLYILAIGPFDYLLLKRGLKRMEWTWFTFPAIVLVFSGTAYFLAYWLKGDQLLTNQVDVIDYDAETKLVRGTTWSNLFSPRVDAYDLQYKPVLPDKVPLEHQERLISWTGLPGNSFAGMSSPGGGAGLFTGGYSFSPALDRLENMPIAVWSTKGVTGRWHGEASPPVLAELVDRGDRMLAGSIQSRLDEPLTECVLVYDRWAYPIGTLEARARFSVEKKLDPQTIETYFKHISFVQRKRAAGNVRSRWAGRGSYY